MPNFLIASLAQNVPPEFHDALAEANCCQCGALVLLEHHFFLVFAINHIRGTHLICEECDEKGARAWLN